MLGGERRVKWLDAQRRRIGVETLRRHEGYRSEPPDVPIVERPAVIENELQRRIAALPLGKRPGIDEESAREARLNDDSIVRGEIENNELRAAPCSYDRRPGQTPPKGQRCGLAKHVAALDDHPVDAAPGDLAIQ